MGIVSVPLSAFIFFYFEFRLLLLRRLYLSLGGELNGEKCHWIKSTNSKFRRDRKEFFYFRGEKKLGPKQELGGDTEFKTELPIYDEVNGGILLCRQSLWKQVIKLVFLRRRSPSDRPDKKARKF